jgi:hypothetical protein
MLTWTRTKLASRMGRFFGIVEVDVQHLAVAAPVAAEVDEDALVGLRGGLEGGGQVGFGLAGIGIDVALAGWAVGGADGQQGGQGEELDDLQREPPGLL